MGLIYCNRCARGVHYTDFCLGGANGHPRLEGKELKRTERWNKAAEILALAVHGSIVVLIIVFGVFIVVTRWK